MWREQLSKKATKRTFACSVVIGQKIHVELLKILAYIVTLCQVGSVHDHRSYHQKMMI